MRHHFFSLSPQCANKLFLFLILSVAAGNFSIFFVFFQFCPNFPHFHSTAVGENESVTSPRRKSNEKNN
jgi:hypothetical protein